MTTRAKQLLALLLALLLCIALFPAALAEDAEEDAGTITLVEEPKQAGTPADPEAITNYGIRVGGTEVTSENKADVLGDGKFVFDGDHTLTVTGSYSMDCGPALENYDCEGLVIVGVDASISTDDGVVVLLKKDTTITGSLHAEKVYGRDPVISAEDTVTVKDGGLSVYHGCDDVTNVEQLRSSRAIDGGAWIFDHASLDASTLAASVDRTSGGSILNWNRVTLTGSHIAEPEGGYVGDYGAIYNVDGSQYYSRVRIEPDESTENPTNYGIRVGGTEVTSENKADVLGDGKFVFDGDHTLTVTGSYSMERGPALENYDCEGLVIVGVDASIYVEDDCGVLLGRETTITGSLTVNKTWDQNAAVYASNYVAVTLKDGSLTVRHGSDNLSNTGGFTSYPAISGGKWTIDNATLDATTLVAEAYSTSGKDILRWFGVTMKRCLLTEPEGGYIGEDGKVYAADGTQEYFRVRIQPVENPFVDVKEGKYYYEPVLWAYYHDPQITGGISDTEFGPNKTCTREQIVTFLWKAMGAPEPETTVNPFEDVKSTKYYYKPVLWAVENGITGGVGDGKFGVGQPCTRAQVVTFLYAAAGKPPVENTDTGFVDVPANAWYATAVAWAKENGITGGVDATHFGPNNTCTRAQVVTFLYAAAGKPWG